jgi:hypothetical protein
MARNAAGENLTDRVRLDLHVRGERIVRRLTQPSEFASKSAHDHDGAGQSATIGLVPQKVCRRNRAGGMPMRTDRKQTQQRVGRHGE